MYHFELKPSRRPSFETEYFSPACEIMDEEKGYAISLDIPGIKQSDIDIEVKDNRLHIIGERKAHNSEQTYRSEKSYGKFSRVFSLPQNVNADSIQARFEDGVLDIYLPKEEKSLSKKISISGWGQKLKN